jgi:hypothetical protein
VPLTLRKSEGWLVIRCMRLYTNSHKARTNAKMHAIQKIKSITLIPLYSSSLFAVAAVWCWRMQVYGADQGR